MLTSIKIFFNHLSNFIIKISFSLKILHSSSNIPFNKIGSQFSFNVYSSIECSYPVKIQRIYRRSIFKDLPFGIRRWYIKLRWKKDPREYQEKFRMHRGRQSVERGMLVKQHQKFLSRMSPFRGPRSVFIIGPDRKSREDLFQTDKDSTRSPLIRVS